MLIKGTGKLTTVNPSSVFLLKNTSAAKVLSSLLRLYQEQHMLDTENVVDIRRGSKRGLPPHSPLHKAMSTGWCIYFQNLET